MSYFTPQTKVVKLDDENSVTIRKLTFGPRQEIIDASTGVDSDMNVIMHVGSGRTRMLELSIVSWTGPSFEGRPVTPANIAELPGEVADVILQAADDLQAGLTDDEKKA